MSGHSRKVTPTTSIHPDRVEHIIINQISVCFTLVSQAMDLNTSTLRIITQYPGAYFLSNSYVKRQKSISQPYFPRVRIPKEICWRGKGRKNMSGHSREVF